MILKIKNSNFMLTCKIGCRPSINLKFIYFSLLSILRIVSYKIRLVGRRRPKSFKLKKMTFSRSSRKY
jgi:hypothetical protein